MCTLFRLIFIDLQNVGVISAAPVVPTKLKAMCSFEMSGNTQTSTQSHTHSCSLANCPACCHLMQFNLNILPVNTKFSDFLDPSVTSFLSLRYHVVQQPKSQRSFLTCTIINSSETVVPKIFHRKVTLLIKTSPPLWQNIKTGTLFIKSHNFTLLFASSICHKRPHSFSYIHFNNIHPLAFFSVLHIFCL